MSMLALNSILIPYGLRVIWISPCVPKFPSKRMMSNPKSANGFKFPGVAPIILNTSGLVSAATSNPSS